MIKIPSMFIKFSPSVLLCIVAYLGLTACLKIEPNTMSHPGAQSFTLVEPSKRVITDLRHNYGLPSTKQSKRLEILKLRKQEYPDSLIIGEQYAKYQAELKNFSSATAAFEDITYVDPQNARYNRYLGHCYLIKGEIKRAIFYLDKASSLLSDTLLIKDELIIKLSRSKYNYHSLQYNTYYLLGVAHFIDKNFDQAISSFKSTLNYATVLNLKVISYNMLYMAYRRAGNTAKANEILENAKDIKRITSARIHLKSLEIYRKLGDPNEIARGIKQRYFSEEDFTMLLYCIGNYHISNEQYVAARMVLGRAIEEGKPYTLGYKLAKSDMRIIEKNLLTN